MANNQDFVVKNAVEVGGSTKTTLGSITENVANQGYYITDASYDNKSFSVASQETAPSGVSFKTDGTKMYVIGAGSDTVFQYSLSTAWDVSTASYDSVSFSVASQETAPQELFIKPDGTKLYVVGSVNDTVYQYSLSTAWDMSSASYDSVSFSVASQDTTPVGLFFKSDGTKMYVSGNVNDGIFQYSLSTAWDVSTASYDSISLDVSTQVSVPNQSVFSDDGTKVFVADGAITYSVYQYNLTTAWDLSSGSYANVSFDLSAQGESPRALFFSSDGTKMYTAGTTNDTIYQYSTASYADQINLDTGNYFAHSPSGATTYTISNAATNQSFQLEVTGGTEEVAQNFSTTLFTGNGGTQTITNGIDLATDGGLVWIKNRIVAENHILTDSSRGISKLLNTNNNLAEASNSDISSFNSNGFSLQYVYGSTNTPSSNYVAWTFKKEPNFFDIVTYTGNGVSGRTVSHNLGSTPGMIIVKKTSDSDFWTVYHRGTDATSPEDYWLSLSSTNAASTAATMWAGTAPTSTDFTVSAQSNLNGNGATYVAYLFAHDTASDGLIQCGSYTNNSSANVEINLGWTPQWVLVKNVSDAADWIILDNKRGLIDNPTTASSPELQANTTSAESNTRALIPTSTGFYVQSGVDARYNSGATTGTKTYIYMAIRSAADLDLTWPTSIEWAGGVAPAAPATGETDLFSISTDDGGTTYQGFKTADNLS